MIIDYDVITSKGERPVNEDCVRVIDRGETKVFVLADGLGGQGFGDLASHAAIDAVEEFMKNNEFDGEFVKNCLACANNGVLKAQEEKEYFDMRTTLVLLVIHEEKAYWGHVGDSRLYVFSNNKYEYRTPDHSVPQALLNMGEIKEEDIRHHQDRNRLLRALGNNNDGGEFVFDIDESDVNISGRDFLLCSDGFWEWIVEKDMSKVLKKTSDAHICLKNMSNKVLTDGFGNNMDNFSAILVRCRR